MFQNDDFGKDYLKGLKDGLGAKASMIVAEESYEPTEPTIDNHIVKLKATGADVFISITTPKSRRSDQEARRDRMEAAAYRFQRLHLGRQRDEAAGFENAQGILSAAYARTARTRSGQRSRHEEILRFPRKVLSRRHKLDGSVVYGYGVAQTW